MARPEPIIRTYISTFEISGSLRESNGKLHQMAEISAACSNWSKDRVKTQGPIVLVEFVESETDDKQSVFKITGTVRYSAAGRAETGMARVSVNSLSADIARTVRQALGVKLGDSSTYTIHRPFLGGGY